MGYGITTSDLFFDMDGTLVDGDKDKYALDHQRAWKAFAKEAVSLTQAEDIRDNIKAYVAEKNKTMKEYWKVYGVNRVSIKDAVEDNVIRLFPDVIQSLEEAYKGGINRLSIVSRGYHPDTVEKAQRLGIAKYFNSVQGRTDELKGVPNKFPQLLRALAQNYAKNPTNNREYIIIGDSNEDMDLALTARNHLNRDVTGIKVDRSYDNTTCIEDSVNSYIIIPSLKEVARYSK